MKEKVQVHVDDSERGSVELGVPVGVPDAVGVAVGGLAVCDGLLGEALGGWVAEPVCEAVGVQDAVARMVWEGVGDAVRGVADAVALLSLRLPEGLGLGLRDGKGAGDGDGDGLPEGLRLQEGDEAEREGSGPDALWEGVVLNGDRVFVQERDTEARGVSVMVWESVAGVGVSEGVGDGDAEAVHGEGGGGRACAHKGGAGGAGAGCGEGWDGGGVAGHGWLVGWLLPLCPGARPGPPRLQATGGRGCVTGCTSHEPRALGLARVAPARSRRFSSYV